MGVWGLAPDQNFYIFYTSTRLNRFLRFTGRLRRRPPDVRQPYYTIQVGNYTVYYIVHDHVMEARWFRYSRSTRGLSSNPVYDTSNPYED